MSLAGHSKREKAMPQAGENYAGVEAPMAPQSELIVTLNAMVEERSLLKHPFYQTWSAGGLTLERLRNYAAQYYRHVEAFPRYLSAIHSRCEDLETRQALLDNLIDEERGAENHPELWLRFAEGLGASRESVLAAAPSPSTRALIDTFDRLAREQSIAAGLAALYVYEAQIPPVAATKIEGLRQFYRISDERSLSFFTTHLEADVFHAQTTARLLERHTATPDQARSAAAAADTALRALWTMLDGV
jgi:pyrroloquinoline-quinone synthase